MSTLLEKRDEVREWTVRKGWREGDAPKRSFGDDMALLHSEVSEAVEAYRVHELQRWVEVPVSRAETEPYYITDRDYDYSFAGDSLKPEGVASELADVMIRMLDNYAEHGLKPKEPEEDLWLDPEKYENFGDALAQLHEAISSTYSCWSAYREMSLRLRLELIVERFEQIMLELRTVAQWAQVDLDKEYEAKMKYNETRSHRHGGKLL